MPTEKQLQNLLKGNPDTQFTSGRQAAEAGRKGGIKSGVSRRKKFASRKFLKEALAWNVKSPPELKRALEKMGADGEIELTNEDIGMLMLLKKYRAGDLRAIEMVLELVGEDPHTVLEEKRLKLEKQAVEHMQKSDGFIEALLGKTEEVFEDGDEDTPDDLEDSE